MIDRQSVLSDNTQVPGYCGIEFQKNTFEVTVLERLDEGLSNWFCSLNNVEMEHSLELNINWGFKRRFPKITQSFTITENAPTSAL